MTHMNDYKADECKREEFAQQVRELDQRERARLARHLVRFQPTGAPLHEDLEAHLAAWGWTESHRNRWASYWRHPTETYQADIRIKLDPEHHSYNSDNHVTIDAINRGALL